jgi:ADP-ribose pyrophosphatase YjhB (NUDIX family)
VTDTPSFATLRPQPDDLPREVCTRCGFVNYVNPKIVVGSVVAADDGRVLLCRRAIEPRHGFWTLPAGYLELNETAEEGAMREAREEACAAIVIEGLLAVYSVPHISQIQLMFRARFASPGFSPGPESLETMLFRWDDIPWNDLAFPSVRWALDHWRSLRDGAHAPFTNPV